MTDVLSKYMEERGSEIASKRVVACAVEALTPFWTGRTLADIIPQTCKRYAKKRERAENTVRRELNVLASAVNWAFKNGRLTRPVPVELPSKPPGKERWLSRREVARILRAALRSTEVRSYLPLFILIAVYTGRRMGAILSLRWHQVNLEQGFIDFEGTARRSNKRRGLPRIPERLLPHLRRARRGRPEFGYVICRHGEGVDSVYRGIVAAAKRAGVEGITPHVFKHTAISWGMQNGGHTAKLAAFFATSEKMLIEVYGHLHPEHHREAAEAVSRRPGSGMGR